MFIEISHPLLLEKLSRMRDKNTPPALFRRLLTEITTLACFRLFEDMPLSSYPLETPLEPCEGYSLSEKLVIVPVLRAGLGMIQGVLNVFPEASVGFIGLYRNEETLQPVDYYQNLPSDLSNSLVLLLDPMLATGGSAREACRLIKSRNSKRIKFFCLVAAPEGIAAFEKEHPDVPIYGVKKDRTLTDNGYILPGLGDAGDRLFGTT